MTTRAITTARAGPGIYKVSWNGLLNGDDGAAWSEDGGAAAFSDKTAQITGTFGVGGTVIIEGSNDGTNWGTLNDASSTPISVTDVTPVVLLENPLYVRPRVTAGDGTTNLICIINGRTIIV